MPQIDLTGLRQAVLDNRYFNQARSAADGLEASDWFDPGRWVDPWTRK